MHTRIVLADDHQLFRHGVRALLERESDLEVVGEAADGQQAIDAVGAYGPDLVLMDPDMPGLDGMSATEYLHDEFPRTRVVIVSDAEDDSAVVAAVRAGAIGFVSKNVSSDELLQTIRAAARGEVQFSKAAAARLVRELHAPSEGPEHLTARELEVLNCVAQGLANKEIAWRLHISEKTVKSHVSTILGKFGVDSRTQAALYATRLGLVSTQPAGAARPTHDVIRQLPIRTLRTLHANRLEA